MTRRRGAQDYESAMGTDDKLDLRLWLRLISCTYMIERTLRARLRREFGVTLPAFDVLAQLDRAPGGLSMGDLPQRFQAPYSLVESL